MTHNHLKNLINLGYLIDEAAVNSIENLNENDFYRLLEGLKKEDSFIINRNLVSKILFKGIEIIKEFTHVNKFTIQDYVKNLNEKYNILQNILIKRVEITDLSSINKLSSGNVSIIGLVKDKNEKEDGVIVNFEDTTGEVQASMPKNLGEKLNLDDVVAVSGKINNKILFVEKIIYPDVPLRPVNYTSENIKVAFLEEGKYYDVNYVFHINKLEDKIKNKTYKVSVPCLIELEGIHILITSKINPLDALRKRYVKIENNDFLIEPVPDIIFTDTEVNTNYKGITIVSLNKLIDLKTREVKEIN